MKENLQKLLSIIRPQDKLIVCLLAILIFVTAIAQTAGVASVMPFLAVLGQPEIIHENKWLSSAYDFLNLGSDKAFLYALGIMAFTVFITALTLQALLLWATTRFSSMLGHHLSSRMLEQYLCRPYSFFLTRNSSDLSKTVLQEAPHAVTGALLPAMRLFSHVLLATLIIALLIAIQPVLAVTVALSLGIIYGTVYFVARAWLRAKGVERVKANRERFTAVNESFAGSKEIRLLGRERDYVHRFNGPSRTFAKNQADTQLLQEIPVFVIEGVAFGGIILTVLYLMRDSGSLAAALPIIGVYGLAGKQLIPAFQRIFSTFSAVRYNMPVVESILADLEAQTQEISLIENTDYRPLDLQQGIELRNLSFRYDSANADALEHINLLIRARKTVGFVGSSGAGKSTLVDILLGLLEPSAGEVCIDGTPLTREYCREWQTSLGYVPQHIFLADQSVAENIALGLGKDAIDRTAVEHAAKLANLHEFVISELPEGYNTVIGERGVRLSGGQRQRIGIARALYRNPSVLLFDEATSALDNTTEKAVMEAINNLSGEKTIILVAHRLTTVQGCDEIFVFDKGRIVEHGSWDELSNNETHFNRLARGAA